MPLSILKVSHIAGVVALTLAFSAQGATESAREPRVRLIPRLHVNETLTYQVHYQVERNVKADSRVVAPIAPPAQPIDLLRTIRVEVLEVATGPDAPGIRLRAEIAPSDSASKDDAKAVQFAIDGAGNIITSEGLEFLASDERELWSDWVERFAAVWSLPQQLKPGEKWNSEEAISNSVIAGLVWQKESQYVRDEPCPRMSAQPSRPADSCAVLLTSATLRQKSSAKDTTPEDYKLHDLKTAGMARGTNQIISYVSRTSGVVVRVKETAAQTMDVAISKTDGSNAVRYTIDARSQSEILLTSIS